MATICDQTIKGKIDYQHWGYKVIFDAGVNAEESKRDSKKIGI